MSIDQTLLERADQRGRELAPAVSVGTALSLLRPKRARPLAIDVDRIRALGLDTVRRPTGGRAVLHSRELTYAVAAPVGGSVHCGMPTWRFTGCLPMLSSARPVARLPGAGRARASARRRGLLFPCRGRRGDGRPDGRLSVVRSSGTVGAAAARLDTAGGRSSEVACRDTRACQLDRRVRSPWLALLGRLRHARELAQAVGERAAPCWEGLLEPGPIAECVAGAAPTLPPFQSRRGPGRGKRSTFRSTPLIVRPGASVTRLRPRIGIVAAWRLSCRCHRRAPNRTGMPAPASPSSPVNRRRCRSRP